MKKNNYKFSLIITTSEKYSFLIEECIRLINLFLNDYIDKIYIISNKKIKKKLKKFYNCQFHYYNSDWSSRLKFLLTKIDNENLLLITEDTFILGINKNIFLHCIKNFYQKNTLYMRLIPINETKNKRKIIAIPNLAPYRFSALGFWKKSILNKILISSESPWEFEIMGAYRTREYKNGFLYPNAKIFNTLNIVEKGFITPEGYSYLDKISFKEISRLPKMNIFKIIKFSIFKIIFKRMYLINWEKRLFIMNIFRKIFVSY